MTRLARPKRNGLRDHHDEFWHHEDTTQDLVARSALSTMTRFIPHVLLVLALGACLPYGTGQHCTDDADCGAGECARNNECAPAGTLRTVTFVWTVHGQVPGETTCAPIAELRVTFEDRTLDETVVYEPVPCRLGRIHFNRMHPRFDRVRISAHGPQGELVHDQRFPMPTEPQEIRLDLQP